MSTKKNTPRTISFSYQGKEYVLEFDLESVKQLEKLGFTPSEAGEYPATQLPLLFYGAFRKHHRYVPNKLTDTILSELGNRQELWATLLEMYSVPLVAFFGGDDEVDEGKLLAWTAQ